MSSPDVSKYIQAFVTLSGPFSGASGMAMIKTGAFLLGRSITYFPSIAAASFHGLISFSLAALSIEILRRLQYSISDRQAIPLTLTSVVVLLPIYSGGMPLSLGTAALFVSAHVLGTALTICAVQFLMNYYYAGGPCCIRFVIAFNQTRRNPLEWLTDIERLN